jgi:hypothetical protein
MLVNEHPQENNRGLVCVLYGRNVKISPFFQNALGQVEEIG